MASLCRSTRLLTGTRFSSKQANKTARNFSVLLCNQLRDGQTRLAQRSTALPSESRELASQLQNQRRAASEFLNTDKGKQVDKEDTTRESLRGIPDSEVEFIDIGDVPGRLHPVFLRDACTCSKCVDPSSTQKQFQTTDIPATIRADSVEVQKNGDVVVTWENDIPAFGPDHVSTYSAKYIGILSSKYLRQDDRYGWKRSRLWNNRRMTEELQFFNFEDYMTDDKHLFRALLQLNSSGLLLLRNVPESEESVAQIAGRIGTIRDTFYGRTWDVKSVPKATNVAYTHQFLGLHMDLLYMENPPGYQLLHCLENSCKGGVSLFSDSWHAATFLSSRNLQTLSTTNLAYHYRNAGAHYYYERPVIETLENFTSSPREKKLAIKYVNYSPPFQAPIPIAKPSQRPLFPILDFALRDFARLVESPESLFEYRLKEGECVIFNNRRVLHGRREFEPGNGKRWLKGTYVDTDVFDSKWRTLSEKFKDVDLSVEKKKYVHPGQLEKGQAYRARRRAEAETRGEVANLMAQWHVTPEADKA